MAEPRNVEHPPMDYARYPPSRRISADQVPIQNMSNVTTIDYKGAKYIFLKKNKSDFKQRFCTLQITVVASKEQTVPVIIVFRGKPTPGDPSIPISGKLKKELKYYDKRVKVIWDPKAWMNEDQCQFWYRILNEHTDCSGDRLLQIDGFKTLVTHEWRNQYKRDRIKLILSPAGCTDANTSVVDAHIGQNIKLKVFAEIRKMRDQDTEVNQRIEDEGIGFLRIEMTKWVADAWEKVCQTDMISRAFKSCGVCNDMNGNESHLVSVGSLSTYSVPPPEYVPRKVPYPTEKIVEFMQSEMDSLQQGRKKENWKNSNSEF